MTKRPASSCPLAQQPQQRRRRVGVDEAGGDGDVLDPQVLEVQGGGLAVHTDVGDVPAGPDQVGGELEGGGHADRLDGDVGTEPVGELARRLRSGPARPLLTTTSAPNCLAASSRLSARSMATMWLGLNSRAPHDRGQADRAGADDRDDVARAGRWPLRTPTS